ncbi:MAG: hypothetical protein RSE16_03490 [Sphingobium sp.]|nr:MAG: hypothetical protein RSE16_03490 [Sphingobium sp.]
MFKAIYDSLYKFSFEIVTSSILMKVSRQFFVTVTVTGMAH